MNNYSGSKNILELKGIYQSYKDDKGKEFVVFDDFNLEIEDVPDKGQFVCLLGESGCGKSTLFRYLTQLQKPDKGEILLAGKPLTPHDTIPMVFQSPSSLQWDTVLENVALPLILKGVNKAEAYEKAMAMIKIVDLLGHENKYAKAPLLSGGQLQRVAIARSLVANPNMVLMDEPFSALDSVNRRKMHELLIELFHNSEVSDLNPTVILVTHDIRESICLANDILIMKPNPGHVAYHLKVDNDSRTGSKGDDLSNYIESVI